MITSSILLIFFGSFLLYNTSKKALLQQNFPLEKWTQTHAQKSKIIGLVLIISALLLAIIKFGTTSGILFWLVVIMTVLSMLIILYPTKKLNYKHFVVLFVTLFIVELLN